ncbi:unnamed protein product [Brassica oleracea]
MPCDRWRWKDSISNGTGNATTGSNSGGRGSSSHVHHKAATSSNGKIASATVLGMRRQAIIVVDAVDATVLVAVEQASSLRLESQ